MDACPGRIAMTALLKKAAGLWIVGLAVAVVPTAVASAALPNQPAGASNRGPLVNARFETVDPSGCIVTDTFVSANSGIAQTHPATSDAGQVNDVEVSVYRYDACSDDTSLIDAAGLVTTLPTGAFTVSNQLTTAHLVADVPLDDLVSGTTFTVHVDTTWTGTSAITRNHSNTNDIYSRDCHVLNRWKGSGRTADAAGTVSDGTTDYTSAPTHDGEIGYVIDGFEVVGCF
jgi:hypothetical protein